MMKRLACAAFPTTIVAVDDNDSFLDVFRVNLKKNYRIMERYQDPLDALEKVNQHIQPSESFIKKSIKPIGSVVINEIDAITNYAVDVNVEDLHQLIYEKNRFHEIAVIVIDYAMPELNGLDFCQRIKNPHIKKILVTSEADTEVAVEAFNAGMIDHFIQKNEPIDRIVRAVIEMEKKYFEEISLPIIQHFAADDQENCFSDPEFMIFFRQLCDEKNICEFYLIDEGGTFLLLNKEGVAFWLIVKNEREMTHYTNLAKGSLSPEAVIHDLAERKKIPFLYTFDQKQIPWPEEYATAEEWEPVLHPANTLTANKKYYYALVSNPELYPLETENILTYNEFLRGRG